MKKIELNSKIPAFTFASTDPAVTSLKDFKGQHVVVYFYPKDNTPGCTTEGLDFKTHFKKFAKLNTAIVGISRDSLSSHEKFCEKLSLPFPLISDQDEKICNLFGVLGEKNLYGKISIGVIRSTFLIDKEGVVQQIWRSVKVPNHVEQVLDAVAKLNSIK